MAASETHSGSLLSRLASILVFGVGRSYAFFPPQVLHYGALQARLAALALSHVFHCWLSLLSLWILVVGPRMSNGQRLNLC